MPANLRTANRGDLDAITAIYAHHVVHGTGTFELTPPSAEEMAARFDRLTTDGYPWLVVTNPTTDTVLGYGYLGPFRERPAYRYFAEDSIYLHPDHCGQGLGRILLEALIAAGTDAGYTQIVALIGDATNAPSINLHRSAGFEECGLLRQAGYKFDRWLDVVIMQRRLGPDLPPDSPSLFASPSA